MSEPILEPAAQEIADATSKPPYLYELGVEDARKVLDDIQAAPMDKPDVAEKWIAVPADVGPVTVRIVKPVATRVVLPTVLYMHGGGWVLGNAGTHDRLVRELAVGANAAVVFVEYDRSPSSRDTRPPGGSPSTAGPRDSTRRASPSPATPSAGT
jgi:acetyl esterase